MKCKRCGRNRKHYALGLCNACYIMRRRNSDIKLRIKANKDTKRWRKENREKVRKYKRDYYHKVKNDPEKNGWIRRNNRLKKIKYAAYKNLPKEIVCEHEHKYAKGYCKNCYLKNWRLKQKKKKLSLIACQGCGTEEWCPIPFKELENRMTELNYFRKYISQKHNEMGIRCELPD